MKYQLRVLMALGTVGLFASTVLAKEYHVSVDGCDANNGSKSKPFKTIQAAADVAQPGDVITIHEGIYRERVNPPRGGTSDKKRITYRTAKGEKVVVKGSEIVKSWEKVQDKTWKAVIPNDFFGDFNPFNDLIHGDWFGRKDRDHHTGAVYLNGHWLTEAAKLDEVQKPIDKTPLWFAQVDDTNTTIWAQFKGVNPNEAEIEVNVRRTVFYPDKPGRDYITVRGFTMMHAATPWAPPTAEQIGLIGTHWSKGWIIEDNDIRYSICTGVTLGKYGDEFDNKSQSAEGYVATIKRALENGWAKENIGYHIVRNNRIAHCEQAGLVGSLGAVFSRITDNVIHDIHVRRLFSGAEMAAIKIHASNDMLIANNHIYRGHIAIWLDWMAQGVRVTSNLFHDNSLADVLMEVNHGPYVVDNNVLLSETSLWDCSQGGCYAHNLFGGQIKLDPAVPKTRQTPYLKPHSTQLAGYSKTRCGDNRFYNNIFAGGNGLEQYADDKLWPSFVEGNVYLGTSKPYPDEKNSAAMREFDASAKLVEKDGAIYLHLTLPQIADDVKRPLVITKLLDETAVSKASFENYDGMPLKIDRDYFGKKRNIKNPAAGSFERIGDGEKALKVWPAAGVK